MCPPEREQPGRKIQGKWNCSSKEKARRERAAPKGQEEDQERGKDETSGAGDT